jgi:hypothetical protein
LFGATMKNNYKGYWLLDTSTPQDKQKNPRKNRKSLWKDRCDFPSYFSLYARR